MSLAWNGNLPKPNVPIDEGLSTQIPVKPGRPSKAASRVKPDHHACRHIHHVVARDGAGSTNRLNPGVWSGLVSTIVLMPVADFV